jgi:exonuclease SbcD
MKLVHFADLHLGVERYSRLDPETGLPSRLLDFLGALDQLVDYAIAEKVDLVLFAGDAYQSREPGQTHQREFAKRIRRLTEAGIPILLLVGNHDMPNALGRATSTEIFDTLGVTRVHVANRPGLHRIATPSGEIQVIALPWLRRAALLSREDGQGLTFEDVNARLSGILSDIIKRLAADLDPALPAVVCAHVWVQGASPGSEHSMILGDEHTLLPSSLTPPGVDYVALGHIHRHQIVSQTPPVVYAGSLERVDFGEEGHDKGFYVVDIDPAKPAGERASYEFHILPGRDFITIRVELEPGESDPTAKVLGQVEAHGAALEGAIVRLQISLPVELEAELDDAAIRAVLKPAQHYTISREVQREARARLGTTAAEEITPIEALAGLGSR